MTGHAKTVIATAVAISTRSDSKSNEFAQFCRQHADDDIHADLTAFPGDGAAAGKDAADHEEKHDLLRPWDRHAEDIAADDIGKIDRHARDQENRRQRAGDREQPTHALEYRLDHGRIPRRASIGISTPARRFDTIFGPTPSFASAPKSREPRIIGSAPAAFASPHRPRSRRHRGAPASTSKRLRRRWRACASDPPARRAAG